MEFDAHLWQKIDNHKLDQPGAVLPFSKKLAREQGWSTDFTRGAIREYKRFCYLAATASHPVSPSVVVDEVWHLHLTYTQDYWKQFCPNVLGFEFHHNPTLGGSVEKAKHQDWYAKTLKSYQEAFGEDPPARYWLNSPLRVPDPQAIVVQRRTADLLGKFIVVATFGTLLAGTVSGYSQSPLDLTGQDFLKIFLVLWVAALAIAAIARYVMRTPAEGDESVTHSLSPVDLAILSNGKLGASNAVLTSMILRRIIEPTPTGKILSLLDPAYQPQTVIEKAVLNQLHSNKPVDTAKVRKSLDPLLDQQEAVLEEKGLLLSRSQKRVLAGVTWAIAASPLLLGIPKIMVGIQRDRPVEFLMMLCVFCALASLFFLFPPIRTRFGDRILKVAKDLHFRLASLGLRSSKPYVDPQSSITGVPNEIMLGVGLFGVGALAGHPDFALVKRVQPAAGASGCGGGVGCASGGGDGGGGGCGGGGCGGCGS